MSEENFYVEMHDAHQFRKDLLVSSKQLIHVFKKQKDYQVIRAKKLKAAKELSKILLEIKNLADSLKNVLPKTKSKLCVKPKKVKEELIIEDKEDLFHKKLSRIEAKLQALE